MAPVQGPELAGVHPHGTVTFLFSDIESSTQHWQQRPAAMWVALRKHNALIRAAIESNAGYLFKTVGDEVCATFWRPADAIRAAVAAQRALASENWSEIGGLHVRMALHSGSAQEHDGDYFGPTVNRIARLLAVAHGDQIVVSAATAQLLRDAMPDETELIDLGEHRLKDFAEREHVWQVQAPGVLRAFPPLRSLDSLPNNLPRQLTPLIGREAVVGEVDALVRQHPLVTLVGTGGVGKTRVAFQVGAELLDAYRDGVWFVDLAPVADGAAVAKPIASVFDLRESSNSQVADALLAYLKSKETLVILDNCEHVIEGAAQIVTFVLQNCPNVCVLATSREPLGVEGESLYRMPSLGVPPPESIDGLRATEAQTYGSVALFVERARSADRSFQLSDGNAGIVADICQRLDGIALAIELAAARTRFVSLKDLSAKLDERFHVLAGGRRTALPRQQTLRATIDWSYDLLSEAERTLFRRLSVFSGDFSFDAVALICTRNPVAEADVFDILASLADKSLLQAESIGGNICLRLLQSMRAYAGEKLRECGEVEAISRAHACAYLTIAESLESSWETSSDVQWKALAEPALENWRAALRWAFGVAGDRDIAQRLVAALKPVWFTMAPSEGQRWVRDALDSVDAATSRETTARLDLTAAHLAMVGQQYKDALLHADRALRAFTTLGDSSNVATARLFAGAARGFVGDAVDGEAQLQVALDAYRLAGNDHGVGAALAYMATLRLRGGDTESSRRLFAGALDAYRSVGAARPAAHVALNIAELEYESGNAAEAVRLITEALETERALKDRDAVAWVLCNLAAYLVALERWDDAAARAREALGLARERAIAAAMIWALHRLAAVAALRPIADPTAEAHARRQAANIIGFVDAQLAKLELIRDFTDRQEYAVLLDGINTALGSQEAAARIEEGRAWTESRAVEEALLL